MRTRRLIPTALLLAVLIVLGVWRFVYDGADPRLIFSPPPPAEPLSPAALDELAEVHADDQPLGDVLANLARRYQIQIDVDKAAFKDAGIAPLKDRVTLRGGGLTLRSLLEFLVRQVDDRLVVGERANSVLVTTEDQWDSTLNNYVTRIYRLDEILGQAEGRLNEQDLAKIVESAAVSDDPPSFGGIMTQPVRLFHGDIQIQPGALVVRQLPGVHRRIESVLNGLARAQRERDRRAPLLVGLDDAGMAARQKLLTALNEQTSLEVVDQPLEVILRGLSRRHGVPIVLISHTNASSPEQKAVARAPLTHKADGILLRSLLQQLSNKVGLEWFIRDGAVVVALRKIAYLETRMRIYPVGDLLHDELTAEELVNWTARLFDYNHFYCLDDQLIVLRCSASRGELEPLLAELRRARRGTSALPSKEPSPATKRILAALDAPVRLESERMTLQDALEMLADQSGINIELETSANASYSTNSSGTVRLSLNFSEVHLPAGEMPLRTALAHLDGSKQLSFVVCDETLWILKSSSEQEYFTPRLHHVPPALQRIGEQQLLDTLRWSIDMQEPKDRLNAIRLLGNDLVVFAFPTVHARLEHQLPLLAEGVERADSAEVAPIDLLSPPSELDRRCLEALNSPTSIDAKNEPLDEILRRLAKQHGVPIVFDWHVRMDDRKAPVSLQVDAVTLQTALNRLGLSVLGWTVQSRGAIVLTKGWVVGEDHLAPRHLRGYPVADFATGGSRMSIDDLLHGVADVLKQWPRSQVESNDTACSRIGNLLLVDTTPEGHRGVERILTTLREMRGTDSRAPVTVTLGPGSRENAIWETLDRPADIIVEGEELHTVLRRIAKQHALPLWIIDWSGKGKRVHFRLLGAPLGRALEFMLAPYGLAFVVSNETLTVTSQETEVETSHGRHRVKLYPIGDLQRRYPRIVAETPTVGAWIERALAGFRESNGCAMVFGDALLVTGSAALHRATARILEELRHDGANNKANDATLLECRVGLSADEAPLDEVLDRFAQACGAPICLQQIDAGRDDPFLRAVKWRLMRSHRVSCEFQNLPLREAVAAISPFESPLAAHVDDGVVIVEPRDDFNRRTILRCHSVETILTEFPELNSRQLCAIVRQCVTPYMLFWYEEMPTLFGSDAAPLPNHLVVLHTPRGHSQVESLLHYLATQTERFPRPYHLARDDNGAAVSALARRLARAEDPHEIAWLAAVVTFVRSPPENLASVVAKRWIVANRDGRRLQSDVLQDAVEYCGVSRPCVLSHLASELNRELDVAAHRRAVTLLGGAGDAGREVLNQRLMSICTAAGDDAPQGAMLEQVEDLLNVLDEHYPTSPVIIPALVTLLHHSPLSSARAALNTIDEDAKLGLAYIARRLEKDDLPLEERRWLETLQRDMNEPRKGSNPDPFGLRPAWGYTWHEATGDDPFGP